MNRLIQTASLAACPRAMYLASVVEVDTVLYFLLSIQEETIAHHRFSIFWVSGKIAVRIAN